jgi:hypothetical protein
MDETVFLSAQKELGGWSSASGPEGVCIPQDWKTQAPGR